MDRERPISREKFEMIVRGCLGILARRGFIPQVDSVFFPRSSEIFEDICFGFFGDVGSGPDSKVTSRTKVNLTHKILDEMTLECALIFIQQGVESVHYNESLNHIRVAIADVLEAMGYEIDADKLCQASRPGWGCYKSWEEVARQDGLTEDKIVETRNWFKENRRSHYEE